MRSLLTALLILPFCALAQPQARQGGRQTRIDFTDRRHFDSTVDRAFRPAGTSAAYNIRIATDFSPAYHTRINSYYYNAEVFRYEILKFDDRGLLVDFLRYGDTTLLEHRRYSNDDKGRIRTERITIYPAMFGSCCTLARLTLADSLTDATSAMHDSLYQAFRYRYDDANHITDVSDSTTTDGDLVAEKTSYAWDEQGRKTEETRYDQYPANPRRFTYHGKEIGSKNTYTYNEEGQLTATTQYFLGSSNRTDQAGMYLYTTEETRLTKGRPTAKITCYYYEEKGRPEKATCETEKLDK